MRPARVVSSRVKILPWYYADRHQPSRFSDLNAALKTEEAAEENSTDILGSNT